MSTAESKIFPPASLYKYLAPERITDVLETATFKFTRMANTNDIFEVRKTFERIAGPRFKELMLTKYSQIISKKNIEDRFLEKLAERVGRSLSRNEKRLAIAGFYKEGIDKQFRDGMASAMNLFEDYVNTDMVREQFLQMFGNDMLCFSLSEEFGIPPMWAFYAGNHSGIVIEVSTESSWFKNKDDISKTRLHKVHYIDGVFDEILDNPQAAFGSKTTVWSYEKEWRMYCGPNDIEKTISASPDPIHLIGFPSDVVKSVIVGFRASDDVIAGVRRVVNKNYPHAGIFLAAPNNKTSAIEISPI